jgi:hypothetical protein
MISCVACSTTLLHHCTAVGCFIAAYEATNIPRHLTIRGWEVRRVVASCLYVCPIICPVAVQCKKARLYSYADAAPVCMSHVTALLLLLQPSTSHTS